MAVKKAKNTKFFCRDCYVVFEILSDFDGREFKYKHCPGCGDHVAVEPYIDPTKSGYKSWSDAEVKLLDRYIAGEIHIYQLKILTGRNDNTIYMKSKKRLKELGVKSKRKPQPWTNEQIELLDKLINGELTVEEVMKITDRKYKSVENRKAKRIRELGLKEEGERINAWTTEELELADRCISGEMTTRELSITLNKNWHTTRNFVTRRKKKMKEELENKKQGELQ